MEIKNEEKKQPAAAVPKASAKDIEKSAQTQKEEKIEKEVEQSFRIHTMPKKYKVAAPTGDRKNTKVVGVVIIVLGLLTMAALIVAAYFYFIKPQTQPGTVNAPVVVKKTETEKAPIKKEEVVPKKAAEETADKKNEIPDEGAVKNPENETAATTSPAEEASSSPAVIASSTLPEEEEETISVKAADADSDGLFDSEESILGSNSSSTDSDQDGYKDLDEVLGLYNPINTDKLYANPGMSKYSNEYLRYSLLYPKNWRMSVVGDNDSVVFAIGDGSFINLIASPNTDHKDIVSWVNELLPKAAASEENVIEGKNWRGLFHENGRIFYLTDNTLENIFIFDYSPAREDYLDYYNIFQVMIKSFAIED